MKKQNSTQKVSRETDDSLGLTGASRDAPKNQTFNRQIAIETIARWASEKTDSEIRMLIALADRLERQKE